MDIQIAFQGEEVALVETLEVTPLGGNLFRLENSPLFSDDACFGDVVELSQDGDTWNFVRVAEPSGWIHFSYILAKSLVESEPFEMWLDSITERGGFWEVAFGGVVFIHHPPNGKINAQSEFDELVGRTDL